MQHMLGLQSLLVENETFQIIEWFKLEAQFFPTLGHGQGTPSIRSDFSEPHQTRA